MKNTIPPSATQITPQLLQEAERQVVKWRKRRRYGIGFFGLLALFPLLLTLFWHPSVMTPLYAHLMVDPLFFGMLGLLICYLMRPTRRNPLNVLWDTQDAQAIGPLAEAMQMALPETSMKAARALQRLLPLINEHNQPHLSAYQRACLHRILGAVPQAANSGNAPLSAVTDAVGISPILNVFTAARTLGAVQSIPIAPELAEAILYAYIYMGDSDDLSVVQRLARPNANPLTQTVGAAKLHKTAQEVLPLLEERVKQQEARDISLRPSTVPISDTSMLLHPAHGVSSQPAEELLRADQADQVSGSQEACNSYLAPVKQEEPRQQANHF